jgi:hypothetical protein
LFRETPPCAGNATEVERITVFTTRGRVGRGMASIRAGQDVMCPQRVAIPAPQGLEECTFCELIVTVSEEANRYDSVRNANDSE